MTKKIFAEIEEFEYNFPPAYVNSHLFRIKITREYTIFGKTWTRVFTAPIVFKTKELAKEFLQYDIKYKLKTFYFDCRCNHETYGVYQLTINGIKCYARCYIDNLIFYTSFDGDISYNKLTYDKNVRIFRELLIIPKGTDINKVSWKGDGDDHIDLHAYYDFDRNKQYSWRTIQDMFNYFNEENAKEARAERIKRDSIKDDNKFNVVGVTKYELLKI